MHDALYAQRIWFDAAAAGDNNTVKYWRGRCLDLEKQIWETQPGTVRGVLVKLQITYNEQEIKAMERDLGPGYDMEVRCVASVYRDLERLAGARRPVSGMIEG